MYRNNEMKGDISRMAEFYRGRRVLVLGLGRSGLSAVRLLSGRGAVVSAADENIRLEQGNIPGEVDLILGSFNSIDPEQFQEVILSPGVPAAHPFVEESIRAAVPVISELELGYRFCGGDIIAVTGSNGKSTTVSMIGAILSQGGYQAVVAGNVGIPFCSVVEGAAADTVFVVEVSSFQLETIRDFHPRVAGILNLTPDHLDRYESEEHYYRVKGNILHNCNSEDLFFYNADDHRCRRIASRFDGRKTGFSSSGELEQGICLKGNEIVSCGGGREDVLLRRRDIGVVGLHNVENAMAAISSLTGYDFTPPVFREALSGFEGLPHRMQKVAALEGVEYYNDSKATNVEATTMSIGGLKKKVILIAGGYDKGGDYSRLEEIRKNLAGVVVIGDTADVLESIFQPHVPVCRASDMKEAVDKASRKAAPGQLVVLSPACASFDMYRNFEQRGEVFMEAVRELEKKSHEG